MATILVVDDRPSNRDFLVTLLGYLKHDLLEAADGEEALRLVRSARPDLVITDILMPTMDGYEFTQRLRADPGLAATPVIFYTATYSEPQARQLAAACGVRAVLPKPSEPAHILAVVNEILGGEAGAPQAPFTPGSKSLDMAGIDDTFDGYVTDLRGLQVKFDALAQAGSDLPPEHVRGLSRQFSENLVRMQRLTSQLSAVVEVGMAMNAEREPARLVKLFFAAACEVIDSNVAGLGLLDEREGTLAHVLTRGVEVSLFGSGEVPRSGLLGSLIAERRTILAVEGQTAEAEFGLPRGHPRVGNLLALSVATPERIYGWLYFAERKNGEPFSEEDARLARLMATELALRYEHALLYDAVQRHAAVLQLEVTERRRAEEDLRRFRLALDNSADMVLIVDRASLRYVDMNETACRLLGYTREELLRLGPHDILPGTRAEFEASYDALIADPGKAGGMNSYYLCKDGSRLPFESTRHVLRSRNTWLIAAVSRDIRGRIAAENALRESESALRRAQGMAKMAHLVTGPGGGFERWSENLPQLVGLQVSQLPRNTRDWVVHIHPEDRGEFRRRALQAAKLPHRYEVEYRLNHAGGWKSLRQHIEPLATDPSRKDQLRWFSTIQDVSEQKRNAQALVDAERKFRQIFENSVEGIYQSTLNGKLLGANPAVARMLGYASVGDYLERVSDLGSQVWADAAGRESFIRALRSAGQVRDFETRFRRADGSQIWVSISASIETDERGERYLLGSLHDISERRAQQARIERLSRVQAMLSGINALIVRVSDREELFRQACRIAVDSGGFELAWIGMLDRQATQLAVEAWHATTLQDSEPLLLSLVESRPADRGLAGLVIAGKSALVANDLATDTRVFEPEELLRAGIRSMGLLPLMVGEKVLGVYALFSEVAGFFDDDELRLLDELAGDISFALDHLEKAQRLDHLAYYDGLTGLANRTLFHERMTQYLHVAETAGEKMALAIVDVERLRTINDSLGRQAGDALLRQIAARLSEGADASDLARVGADQFAVVLRPLRGRTQASRRVEAVLRECFTTPFLLNGTEVRIAAKAGVVQFPRDGREAEALLRNSEAALNVGKVRGDRITFHASAMTHRTGDRFALENQLRQALERDEFVLHYQPKVDLESRAIVGVEALIRWQSPDLGLVPPGRFIPLLEETGLILEVGAWALGRAVRDHADWQTQGLIAPRVAVNVSQIQLRKPDFVAIVKAAIGPAGVPPGIDLEITESLLMDDVESNIVKLKALRDLGMQISIDDFGTGYSSLAYLAKLPVGCLKIDRAFIIAMEDDPDTMTLVQTIISLAHSLRMTVIAEGVEKETQAKLLHLLRCDQMQGYLFSRPVPAEDLLPLLARRQSRA